MPKYSYRCNKDRTNQCTFLDLLRPENEGTMQKMTLHLDNVENNAEKPLTWEVEHSIKEDPEIRCPLCNKSAYKVILPTKRDINGFIFRGNCYLDNDGCMRDMNIFKLKNQDPYGYMRQPGEVDEMVSELRKSGTKRGKSAKTRKYFY